MATHSSLLAWRIPMDRETWWAMVHGVKKQIAVTWQLNTTGSQWHSPWQRPGCVPSASPVTTVCWRRPSYCSHLNKWPHGPASSSQHSVEWGRTPWPTSLGCPLPVLFCPLLACVCFSKSMLRRGCDDDVHSCAPRGESLELLVSPENLDAGQS